MFLATGLPIWLVNKKPCSFIWISYSLSLPLWLRDLYYQFIYSLLRGHYDACCNHHSNMIISELSSLTQTNAILHTHAETIISHTFKVFYLNRSFWVENCFLSNYLMNHAFQQRKACLSYFNFSKFSGEHAPRPHHPPGRWCLWHGHTQLCHQKSHSWATNQFESSVIWKIFHNLSFWKKVWNFVKFWNL